MHKLFLIVVALSLIVQSQAQQAKAGWKDYLSYVNTTKIAISEEIVYCATGGGLMYYDLQDNSINKFSIIAELSDFGIKTISYSTENKVLIIAYTNSNIDLVYGTEVINLSDIKRKQFTGDKSINNISFIGNEAYLSCGFGIVVLNLQKQEVKETYIIGEEGTILAVNDTEADSGYLYAATNIGILKADKNSDNLNDYNNWSLVENIPHSNDKFSHLQFFEGKLIANYTPEEWYQDQMYMLNGNIWEPYLPQIKYAHEIQTNGNYLTISSRENIFVIDNNHSIIGKINNYQFGDEQISPIKPLSSGISKDGSIWVADKNSSMVKISDGNFESIFLNGPMDNSMFSLHQSGSVLWISPGTQRGWEFPRFQRFNENKWDYFTKSNHSELDGFHNIISITVDPFDETHFFAASWGGGLLEYRNDEFIERYTNHNSPLETALPQEPDEPYVRIGGIDFDSDGNAWITNSESGKNLHKLTTQGEWESFVLPEIALSKSIGKLIVTQDDDKWILVPSGNDAYVVDKTGAQKKQLRVTSYFNNGENEIYNQMNDVYSIAEDNEGAIWIGTSKGVAVYSNPSRIWTTETLYATQPSLDLGDGIYHPLLGTETVTAIAVDGANRKWLGTKNSGVYLISESGEAEVLHFTQENSPLLSNEITAIAINQKSGEIFFGTNKGLVSYQGDAIIGKDSYSDVYVYPNPVRETYDGPITVTGLIENTDIKITDISGNLVFKTTSLGGQATWDGTNLNGNRVKTGVYLVFCNDETGEKTHITKLLFIN